VSENIEINFDSFLLERHMIEIIFSKLLKIHDEKTIKRW